MCSKWRQIAPNGSKLHQMAPNGGNDSKWFKIALTVNQITKKVSHQLTLLRFPVMPDVQQGLFSQCLLDNTCRSLRLIMQFFPEFFNPQIHQLVQGSFSQSRECTVLYSVCTVLCVLFTVCTILCVYCVLCSVCCP